MKKVLFHLDGNLKCACKVVMVIFTGASTFRLTGYMLEPPLPKHLHADAGTFPREALGIARDLKISTKNSQPPRYLRVYLKEIDTF